MGLGDLNKAKNAAKDLVSDPVTADNLRILINEAAKAIHSARTNPALPAKGALRDAFNTAATLVPIGEEFVNKKKIPYFTLLKKKGELEKMGEAFERAYNANDPIVLGLLKSIEDNPKVQDATVNLAARNPNAFRLEADGKGGGSLKLDLIPGQPLTVPIEPEKFALAQDIVAKAKAKNQPKPGV